METLLEGLKTRRSCRKYLDKQIEDRHLEAILEAGLYAPSARGKQAVVIVAIQDKEAIATLSKMNAAIMGVTSDPFFGAPTVLLVLANLENANGMADGSCVMENLMLASHSLGLGSCWVNRAKEEFESEEGKALLKTWGLDGAYMGVGHCVVGYADCALPAPPARKENRIYKVL